MDTACAPSPLFKNETASGNSQRHSAIVWEPGLLLSGDSSAVVLVGWRSSLRSAHEAPDNWRPMAGPHVRTLWDAWGNGHCWHP